MPALEHDDGPKPSDGLTWVFTLGPLSDMKSSALARLASEGLLDWIMIPLPEDADLS